jgi:phage terminase Nu1 subunit (DNA packaging protein)
MADAPAKPEKPGVDQDLIAKVCRCTTRTIREYDRMGLLVRVARGRYSLIESLSNIIVHFRELAAGRSLKQGDVDNTESGRLKSAQRRLAELKIAEKEGKLVTIDEVSDVWAELVRASRQLFLSFPGRARFDLPHLTANDARVLERIARELLAETAFADGRAPVLLAKANGTDDETT